MKTPKHLEPGDMVVLFERSSDIQPPDGTVGIITKLYSAAGGPAAYIDWDCDNARKYHNRCLLKHLKPYDEQELNESDASLDILFGGVSV